VGEIADRDPTLTVTGSEEVTRLLERPAFVRVGPAVVVDESGRPVVLISITDVRRGWRLPAGRPAGLRQRAAARWKARAEPAC
jgi:hypothetical protein